MAVRLPEPVKYIINTLQQHGYEAYAVGGCVRDSLLLREPEDWDITTSADPFETRRLFGRTVDTGIKHGTVTVMLGKEGYEVTTYRIDGEYEDGRHPRQVAFTKSLKEDLARRDFTINAMAYNEEDGLVDIFGGEEDLKRRRIRCVGDPACRFDEDALRILRAYRFAAQLNFTIEAATVRAASERAGKLAKISAERIHTELNKLILSDHPEVLGQAYDAGLTPIFLPEFDASGVGSSGAEALKVLCALRILQEEEKAGYSGKERLILALTVLLQASGEESAEAALKRLKYDNGTIQGVHQLIRFYHYRFELSECGMRKAANLIGKNYIGYLFYLKRAAFPDTAAEVSTAARLYAGILERRECVELKDLAVNGGDLIRAGFRQGRELGAVLNSLLSLVLEEPDKNRKEILLREAKVIQKEAGYEKP